MGIMVHFSTWVPSMFISPYGVGAEKYFSWSGGTKMAISLVPNLGLQFGIIMIWFKDTDGSAGMTWDAINTPILSSDNLTLLDIWGSHIISCIIFLILLWYLDNVRPGKYGVAQPLHFPFKKSYWFGESKDDEILKASSKQEDTPLFEAEPNKPKGVEVLELRKVFR